MGSSHFASRRPLAPLLPLAVLLAPAAAALAQTGEGERVLQEVSVTAKRNQTQEMRHNASAGKIIVDREELDSLGASSMAELLGKLPGGGNFADLDGGPRGRQRSPDRNMPQILVDGQPLPGGGRNPMAALRLPVELIERVEIIRNSTPEFPVLSPGGVINLILRDVPSQLTRSAKAGIGISDGKENLRLEGQYGAPEGGDFGYLLAGAFNRRPFAGSQETDAITYSGGAESGRIHEHAQQGGYDDNLTLTPRFSWRLDNGDRLTLTPFLTHTATRRDSRLSRDDGSVASSETLDQDGKRSTGRLSLEWKRPGRNGEETSIRLMLQGERDDSARTTRRYDALGNALASQYDRSLRRENESLLELRRKQLAGDSHLLSGAIEWRDKASDDDQWRLGGGSDSTVNISESRLVGWLQDEWQLSEQQVLTPGLRLQTLRTRVVAPLSGNIEREHRSADPSLHYLWQINEQWNFRASIAANTRTPQTRDLSPVVRQASGINTSGNPDRGGNSALAPEKLRSIEVGIEHYLAERAGNIGLSIFDREIDDYVQRLIADEGGRWVERPRNVGKAQLRGLVLDFRSRLAALGLPELSVRGNLAYTETRMLERIAGLGAGEGPRSSMNIGFDYDIARWRTTLGGNFSHASALDRESSASIRQQQGERRQLDLYALYKFDRQLALRFSAQNITRETRTDTLTELDASGLVSRSETDRMPGIATYFLTLEGKW